MTTILVTRVPRCFLASGCTRLVIHVSRTATISQLTSAGGWNATLDVLPRLTRRTGAGVPHSRSLIGGCGMTTASTFFSRTAQRDFAAAISVGCQTSGTGSAMLAGVPFPSALAGSLLRSLRIGNGGMGSGLKAPSCAGVSAGCEAPRRRVFLPATVAVTVDHIASAASIGSAIALCWPTPQIAPSTIASPAPNRGISRVSLTWLGVIVSSLIEAVQRPNRLSEFDHGAPQCIAPNSSN